MDIPLTYLGDLAQLVLNSVGDAKLLTLCGESTRLLELKEELDTLELSENRAGLGLGLHHQYKILRDVRIIKSMKEKDARGHQPQQQGRHSIGSGAWSCRQ